MFDVHIFKMGVSLRTGKVIMKFYNSPLHRIGFAFGLAALTGCASNTTGVQLRLSTGRANECRGHHGCEGYLHG